MPTLQSSGGDRRHNLAHDDSVAIRNVTPSDAGPAGSGPVEITAVQKMLSATTGSFLTGFLSMTSILFYTCPEPGRA